MTLEQIKAEVSGPNYDFLKTNEHLGKNVILLTLGGSHAYGTNIVNGDFNSNMDILTNQNFEQY